MEEVERRKGCRTGCLVVLLLLLLLIGWAVAMRWGALEKLGLRQPIAEQVFSPPPIAPRPRPSPRRWSNRGCTLRASRSTSCR